MLNTGPLRFIYSVSYVCIHIWLHHCKLYFFLNVIKESYETAPVFIFLSQLFLTSISKPLKNPPWAEFKMQQKDRHGEEIMLQVNFTFMLVCLFCNKPAFLQHKRVPTRLSAVWQRRMETGVKCLRHNVKGIRAVTLLDDVKSGCISLIYFYGLMKYCHISVLTK